MEANLLEKYNVKAMVPANITSGMAGARVPMANAKRVTVLVVLATGTSVTANTVALKQHNAAASGTTKALEVTNHYYTKIDAATEFTAVPVTVAEDTFNVHALVGDDAAVLAFEVLAEDLDRDNGFNHISADLGSAGVARYASIVYIVDGSFKPAYAETV